MTAPSDKTPSGAIIYPADGTAAPMPWWEQSSSAARPCGTCWRCGGTLYEYLVHHCTTNIRLPR